MSAHRGLISLDHRVRLPDPPFEIERQSDGEKQSHVFSFLPSLCLAISTGLLVQWEDAWLATRKSGFDSPVVHLNTIGVMVQRNDSSMACWQSGFDSRRLH